MALNLTFLDSSKMFLLNKNELFLRTATGGISKSRRRILGTSTLRTKCLRDRPHKKPSLANCPLSSNVVTLVVKGSNCYI